MHVASEWGTTHSPTNNFCLVALPPSQALGKSLGPITRNPYFLANPDFIVVRVDGSHSDIGALKSPRQLQAARAFVYINVAFEIDPKQKYHVVIVECLAISTFTSIAVTSEAESEKGPDHDGGRFRDWRSLGESHFSEAVTVTTRAFDSRVVVRNSQTNVTSGLWCKAELLRNIVGGRAWKSGVHCSRKFIRLGTAARRERENVAFRILMKDQLEIASRISGRAIAILPEQD